MNYVADDDIMQMLDIIHQGTLSISNVPSFKTYYGLTFTQLDTVQKCVDTIRNTISQPYFLDLVIGVGRQI